MLNTLVPFKYLLVAMAVAAAVIGGYVFYQDHVMLWRIEAFLRYNFS